MDLKRKTKKLLYQKHESHQNSVIYMNGNIYFKKNKYEVTSLLLLQKKVRKFQFYFPKFQFSI